MRGTCWVLFGLQRRSAVYPDFAGPKQCARINPGSDKNHFEAATVFRVLQPANRANHAGDIEAGLYDVNLKSAQPPQHRDCEGDQGNASVPKLRAKHRQSGCNTKVDRYKFRLLSYIFKDFARSLPRNYESNNLNGDHKS